MRFRILGTHRNNLNGPVVLGSGHYDDQELANEIAAEVALEYFEVEGWAEPMGEDEEE